MRIAIILSDMQNITVYPKNFSHHIRDVFLALEEAVNVDAKSAELTMYLGEVDGGDEGQDGTEKYAVLRFLEAHQAVSKLAIETKTFDVSMPDDNNEIIYGAIATFTINFQKFTKIVVPLSLFPRFIITMNFKDGIVFNNEFTLLKPQDGSQPYHFWQHIIKNPNKNIPTIDILNKIKQKTGTKEPFSVSKTINNYGFIKPLSKAFFPIASAKSVHFQNPVLQIDIDNLFCSEKMIKRSYERLKSNQVNKSFRPKPSYNFLLETIESFKKDVL